MHTTQEFLSEPFENPRAAPPHREGHEVWDHETALWSVGNDLDFFIELVRRFVGCCPKMLADLAAHLSDEDFQRVEDAACGLEDWLRELAAQPARNATRNLEGAARRRDGEASKAALRTLEQELARLNPALRRIGRQLIRSEF